MAGRRLRIDRRRAAVLLAALLANAVAALVARRFPAGADAPWAAQLPILLALSSVVSVALAAVRSATWRYTLLALRFLLVSVACYPQGGDVALELVLMIPLLAEQFVHIPLAGAIAAGAASIGLTVLFQRPMPAWDSRVPATEPAQIVLFAFVALAALAALAVIEALRGAAARAREANEQLERSLRQITEVNAGFQTYATAVERSSRTRERDRISRDIHDSIGHLLINLNMMTEQAIIVTGEDRPEAVAMLRRIQEQTRDGIAEVRRTLYELRSLESQRQPTMVTIKQLTRNFEKVTGVRVNLELTDFSTQALPDEIERVLFHVIQEAMTNAIKHGAASRIDIVLSRLAGGIGLAIWDNGRGAASVVKGIGLSGMEERLAQVGGRLDYRAHEDAGFHIHAFVPVAGAA